MPLLLIRFKTNSLVRSRARAEQAGRQRVQIQRRQREACHVVDPKVRAELVHDLAGARKLLLLLVLVMLALVTVDVIRRRAVLQILQTQRALQSAEGHFCHRDLLAWLTAVG